MLSYRNVLKQSWQITWRNKYLWIFGIFAALLGNGGEYEILSRSLSGDDHAIWPSFYRVIQTGVFGKQTFNNVIQWMNEDILSFLMMSGVVLAILVISCFLIWLIMVSQIAIVNNAGNIIKRKKNNFQDGVNSGTKNFWSILGLNVISKIIICLLLILISLPIIFFVNKISIAMTGLLFSILFIIFVPIAISLSFIIKYAIAYVVVKNSSLINAFKQAWQLFMNNWIISLETALILFFINFVAGLAIALVILAMAIPFLSLGIIVYLLTSEVGFWVIAVLAFISALLLIGVGGAMLAVFQISSWTGLFVELVKNGGTAKIIRVLDYGKKDK
ncbi:MAG: hypothetical protein ABH818_01110 [Patescibacteria group bacterium]|nr:hypothetical protein [Patescibacteria group bacterium]MBU1870749.1 hypothetical protein [Patescibacteria group bacterium]